MKGNKIVGSNGESPRRERDFYPTPEAPVIALIKFLRVHGLLTARQRIWECACGNGAISDVLKRLDFDVVSSDVRKTDYCDFTHDFVNDSVTAANVDWIITNPPFSLADQFIRNAHKKRIPFAYLLKSQYWHAAKRLALFCDTKPSYVLPLTWRPDFTHGGKGSPLMDVLWTIWVPGYDRCEYIPIAREKEQEAAHDE